MKKGLRPITRSANPEPQDKNSISWIIWAAWADRITFEDIKEQTGKSESEVIKIMRKNLSESSFKLWRKRTHNQSIKHRKKFENSRKQLNQRIYFSDDD
ncbi:TIGR03643, TIGR03643 family protein [Candidatus Pelagibacterales bacterium]|jgi:uncharacterized protein (TIGR03643 family)